MSLTSHLKNKDSPIKEYIQAEYPNTRSLMSPMNKKIRARRVIGGDGFSGVEAGIIGTAFDFRVRFHFTNDPITGSVAAEACDRVSDPLRQTLIGLLKEITRLSRNIRAAGREISAEDEELLDRCCLAVAHLEHLYRSNRPDYLSQLTGLDGTTAADQLLKMQSQNVADDLRGITQEYLRSEYANWIQKPHELNPKFVGSTALGGADADLIVDGTLIELKTTKKVLSSFELHQLLGYVLLDWDDAHAITNVALYMARRVLFLPIPVEEFARELSGNEKLLLPDARLAFKDLVEQVR